MTNIQTQLNSMVEVAAKCGNKFAMAEKRFDVSEDEQFIIRYYMREGQQSHYQETFATIEECIASMKQYNKGLRSWRPVSYDFPVKQNS